MKRKPNNYDVATKQIEKYKGISVPTEINENEAHMYHVLLVKSKANPSTLEFENTARIQKFHREVFEKNADKGGFNRLGYDNLFVFHNPTIVEKPVITDEVPELVEEVKKKATKKEEVAE